MTGEQRDVPHGSEKQRSDGHDGAQAHGLCEDHPQHVHLQHHEVLAAASP